MTGDNQTEGLEGSVGIMSDAEMDALSMVQSSNPMCIEMNCQAAYFEERLKAEMQTKYAAVLDKCGHHWFPGYEGSECVRCKLEQQARHYQERARIVEGRAEKAEAEVLDIRTKSTALFKVMDRQIDEADEVAKRAEERVVVLTEALQKVADFDAYTYHEGEVDCYLCGDGVIVQELSNEEMTRLIEHEPYCPYRIVKEALAALHEHEHAAEEVQGAE